jgi:hypothetical protein
MRSLGRQRSNLNFQGARPEASPRRPQRQSNLESQIGRGPRLAYLTLRSIRRNSRFIWSLCSWCVDPTDLGTGAQTRFLLLTDPSGSVIATPLSYTVNRNYTANGLNQYTTAGSASFTYDARGNLRSDGPTNFVYDSENKFISISSAKTATLSYDPLRRPYQVTSAPMRRTRSAREPTSRSRGTRTWERPHGSSHYTSADRYQSCGCKQ